MIISIKSIAFFMIALGAVNALAIEERDTEQLGSGKGGRPWKKDLDSAIVQVERDGSETVQKDGSLSQGQPWKEMKRQDQSETNGEWGWKGGHGWKRQDGKPGAGGTDAGWFGTDNGWKRKEGKPGKGGTDAGWFGTDNGWKRQEGKPGNGGTDAGWFGTDNGWKRDEEVERGQPNEELGFSSDRAWKSKGRGKRNSNGQKGRMEKSKKSRE